MNVNDFEARTTDGDMLDSIFEHQAELHEKYKPIETRNGTGFGIVDGRGDFDINDRYWQSLLKDFSYRVTEELTESAEAYALHLESTEETFGETNAVHFTHAVEELIDSLHFMTEYCIVIGLTPKEMKLPEDADKLEHIHEYKPVNLGKHHTAYYFDVIYNMGVASNLLKQRPWKNAHLITDEDRYYMWMTRAYFSLIHLLKYMGVSPEGIYEMYTKKNSVNNWRINSGY